jgi:hypothetical protein
MRKTRWSNSSWELLCGEANKSKSPLCRFKGCRKCLCIYYGHVLGKTFESNTTYTFSQLPHFKWRYLIFIMTHCEGETWIMLRVPQNFLGLLHMLLSCVAFWVSAILQNFGACDSLWLNQATSRFTAICFLVCFLGTSLWGAVCKTPCAPPEGHFIPASFMPDNHYKRFSNLNEMLPLKK